MEEGVRYLKRAANNGESAKVAQVMAAFPSKQVTADPGRNFRPGLELREKDDLVRVVFEFRVSAEQGYTQAEAEYSVCLMEGSA